MLPEMLRGTAILGAPPTPLATTRFPFGVHMASLEPWCNVGDLGWEAPLEKEMATDSSTLAWRIPWTEEPGRLQSMGSLRVGTRLSDFPFTFHFHALEKEMYRRLTPAL